jgi:hypothetical protein
VVLSPPVDHHGLIRADWEAGQFVYRSPFDVDWRRENQFLKQVVADRGQFCGFAPYKDFRDGTTVKDVQQKSQADDVIQMGVTEQDIEPIGSDQWCESKDA